MSTSLLDLLIITTFCLSVYNGVGFAFSIEISPDKVNGLIHNEVNIVCKLEKSDRGVHEIMLLELSKEGRRIAVLRQNLKLSIKKGKEEKYQAKGTVSQPDVLDSYLEVTLKNPRVEDSGPHTCHLYSIDELAIVSETRATGNLTVSDEDIKTVVMNLVEKVSTLEKEHCDRISTLKESHNEAICQLERQLDLQKNETMGLEAGLSKQKDIHKYDVEQLKIKFSKQKSKSSDEISSLEGKLDKQEQRIQSLIKKGVDGLFDVQKNETLANQELISELKAELSEQKNIHKYDVEQLQNQIIKQKNEPSDQFRALEGKLDKQEQCIQNLIEKDIDMDGLFDVQKNETLANQELIFELKVELKQQKDVHKYDVEQLQNKVSKQKGEPSDEISVLEGKLDKQGQRIQNLIEKVNTTVFFTAWHTRTDSFKTGAGMVYDDVVENVGGAYNGSTGKFTAPVDGLYFFDVSVSAYAWLWIIIDLKTSDGRLLTRLWDYDEQNHSYSDTSCVVKLYAGEYVHPVVYGFYTGYTMNNWERKDPVNKFYGFLIKTL